MTLTGDEAAQGGKVCGPCVSEWAPGPTGYRLELGGSNGLEATDIVFGRGGSSPVPETHVVLDVRHGTRAWPSRVTKRRSAAKAASQSSPYGSQCPAGYRLELGGSNGLEATGIVFGASGVNPAPETRAVLDMSVRHAGVPLTGYEGA